MTIKDHGAFEAWQHGINRSEMWPSTRRAYLKQEKACAACSPDVKTPLWPRLLWLGRKLTVHHIFPIHILGVVDRLDLEHDSRNLITLCTDPVYNHHLLVGHLGSYGSWSPFVRRLVHRFYNMTAVQIQADPLYDELIKNRPKDLFDMDSGEIERLADQANRMMPRLRNV